MGTVMGRAVRGAWTVLLLGIALAAPAHGQGTAVLGRVTDADGRPVRGATVRATAEDSAPARDAAATQTQNGGGFQLGLLRPGSYRLRVDAEGYAPLEERVTVGPGERRTVVLRLRPERRGRRAAGTAG